MQSIQSCRLDVIFFFILRKHKTGSIYINAIFQSPKEMISTSFSRAKCGNITLTLAPRSGVMPYLPSATLATYSQFCFDRCLARSLLKSSDTVGWIFHLFRAKSRSFILRIPRANQCRLILYREVFPSCIDPLSHYFRYSRFLHDSSSHPKYLESE